MNNSNILLIKTNVLRGVCVIDTKKLIKDFIDKTVEFVITKHKNEMHTGFRVELSNDRTAYLIADKGIEKRIQKILGKKYGLASNVIYELIPSVNMHLDGSLRIKIVDDKWRNKNGSKR